MEKKMEKLRLLSMSRLEDVPDHVIEEMKDFSIRLAMDMKLHVDTVSPNIALSSLNWAHCVMIKYLVSNDPEELRKAVEFSCAMLIENMELLIKNRIEK
jgi:hypothetical protein